MNTELIQITREIPPLRQSYEIPMACPTFYAEAVIRGNSRPESLESRRGVQIHDVHIKYDTHCARRQVSMDLAVFDELAQGAGKEAVKILAGIRDTYQVDYAHFETGEVYLSLDETFQPTEVPDVFAGECANSEKPVHYHGKPDALYFYRDEKKIVIRDWKSHFQAFDPAETLQGKEYPLLLMQHFPWCETLMFELVFVRYAKMTRQVTYTRADVPKLIEAVKGYRELQKKIEADYAVLAKLDAVGGPHCFYCSLASNMKCPLGNSNPNLQGRPEEWLSWALQHNEFARVNTARMKAWVQANGRPIVLRDFNGKSYFYGPETSTSTMFPLFNMDGEQVAMKRVEIPEGEQYIALPDMPIVAALMEWRDMQPEDTDWYADLRIGSTELSSKLKTKGRVFLDQSCKDAKKITQSSRYKISKPLSAIPAEVDEAEGEETEE